LQDLQPDPLDSEVDFQNVPDNGVSWRGDGKTVYWRGSNVGVYVNDSEGNLQWKKNIPEREGKLQVPSGVKLYVTDGKVTEQ
jgi:hypothetical protein